MTLFICTAHLIGPTMLLLRPALFLDATRILHTPIVEATGL